MKIVKTQLATLASPFSSTAASFTLTKLLDSKGNAVTLANFGTWFVAVFKSGTTTEMAKCNSLVNNADGSVTIGIASNGRDLNPTSPYVGSSVGQDFPAGADVIITNDPYTMSHFVDDEEDHTVGGKITFSQVPSSSADPVAGTDLTRLSFVQALVLGTLTTIDLIVPGTAGVTITQGQLIYLDTVTGTWKLADASSAATVNNTLLGIAQGAGAASGAIASGVLLQGVDTHQSGLTQGQIQYATNTPGAISNTPGTTTVAVGIAKSATSIYFNPRFDQQLTNDQINALAGTSGTPSSSNKFVTATDADATGAADKIVRATGTSLPTLDASNLTGISFKDSFPRGETINGSTTPVPVVLINDIFQEEFGGSVTLNFGKVTTGNKHAVKFTPQAAITLTTLQVYLKKAGTPTDNAQIKIETDSAGSPSGTPVTNGTAATISGSGLTTSFVLTTATFPGTVTLAAGTSYWITFQRDSTTSDTNYYSLDGIAVANIYAAYSGKTNNASAWSAGDIPYFKIIAATGSSYSAWKVDTDHANYHHRFFLGFIATDGAAGVSANVNMRGVLSGFSGLTPNSPYYAQDTVGTIGTSSGTTESIVGLALTPTHLLVGWGTDKPQYIGSMSLASGANPISQWGLQQFRFFTATFGASATVGDITIYKTGKTTGENSNLSASAPDNKQGLTVSLSGTTVTLTSSGNSVAPTTVTGYFYR